MLRSILITLALLAASTAAMADSSKDKGFYVMGAFGRSIYDEGGSFGNFGDDEDQMMHIGVGYKFFRYLSVEARYTDFGSFNVFFDGVDVSATSLHVLGIAPFGQSGWEFFGGLGAGSVDLNYDFDTFLNGSESTVSGGFGFRWYPTPKVALGIQTDAFIWDDNNDWESSVGGTQLSIQVIF